MTLGEARTVARILEDTFPLVEEAQRKLVRLLNQDFPQFTWDRIQQMPMIIMVGYGPIVRQPDEGFHQTHR